MERRHTLFWPELFRASGKQAQLAGDLVSTITGGDFWPSRALSPGRPVEPALQVCDQLGLEFNSRVHTALEFGICSKNVLVACL